MTESKSIALTRRIFSATFTAVTVILGVLFIWQVVDIYHDGLSASVMYSREIVGERLTALALPTLLWLALAITAFVLSVALPEPERNAKRVSDVRVLYLLKKRMPREKEGFTEQYELVRKEERLIKYLRLAVGLLAFGGVVFGVAYMVNNANFPHENVLSDMLRMVKYIFPVVAVVFALVIALFFYESFSATKQLPAVKQIVKGERIKEREAKNALEGIWLKVVGFTSKPIFTTAVRSVLGAVAVAFIIVGIINGGMATTFAKAVAICTECIGLG